MSRQRLKTPSEVGLQCDGFVIEVVRKRIKHMYLRIYPPDGRVCLSTPEHMALIKKSADALEYVVVHGMVHLLERSHNSRFVALMDRYLPEWRLRKMQLNRADPEPFVLGA